MKSSKMLAWALLVAVITQTTLAQIDESPQAGPTCGTDAAMARMPAESKSMMRASAVAAQSEELLLYINFNPNGSIVRPGFGNADTLTSSIVNGQRFCPAPLLDQAQQDEIVRLVSDDYSPFNIRVTTDAAEFAAHPRLTKQMVLITTTPSVISHPSGTGGVSPWAGLGMRLPGDFAFVFSSTYGNLPQDVAGVVSHESAHLLGLGHQHVFTETCGFLGEYHPGFGTGPLSFKPLMGNGIGDGIKNWFTQTCPGPTFGQPQNDYELINSQVAVRPDDFPDEPEGEIVEDTEITGVLERARDVDHVKINFRKPGPVFISSDNIDLQVALLKPNGQVIETFNDPDTTNLVIPAGKGMKFLRIRAKRNENMRRRFMTGTYHISY
jgi:hypothetical protein